MSDNWDQADRDVDWERDERAVREHERAQRQRAEEEQSRAVRLEKLRLDIETGQTLF